MPRERVILFHQAGHGGSRRILVGLNLVFLVQEIPTGIVQDHKAAFGCRLGKADDVGGRHGTGGHQLLLPQGLHRLQPVPQLCGLLKFSSSEASSICARSSWASFW